jgi:para-aminobenzoate synthetase
MEETDMRCLIIDNYDSFTWNLADYVSQTFGQEPLVVHNDEHSWSELLELGSFDGIIVSPGPGSVTNPEDFRVSRDALLQDDFPVLGVCLGLQGLAHVYGGEIRRAPVPFHGRRSVIEHDGSALFENVPRRFDGVRYHSLVVAPGTFSDELVVTARSECGLIMGLRHVSLPKWGVQFHPESILTTHGKAIVANFREQVRQHVERRGARKPAVVAGTQANVPAARPQAARRARTYVRRIPATVTPALAFPRLFAHQENCFWLDSQTVREGMARFSFMGCASAENVLSHRVSATSPNDEDEAYLQRLDRAVEGTRVEDAEALPFAFRGGYVGFMSYEMKAALGLKTSHRNEIPDAVWMRADEFVAFDLVEGGAWLVAIAEAGDEKRVEAWMDEMVLGLSPVLTKEERTPVSRNLEGIFVNMAFGRADYLGAIARCKEKIVDGESYEVCLTNSFSFDLKVDPISLYLTMREGNPAPFGAFIKTGNTCILSTSPERFLKVDPDGKVQTKPIKGTWARSEDPSIDRRNATRLANSDKDQAENLMIVDLMRNDLRRVSVPGTVSVPKLMDIESYRTVHQMVSTVESQLKPECGLVELLRAVYPGGSITGAPKIRTMEIIDSLEPESRGVYCGTIGYLGYNRIADLNVAIRTLSYDGSTLKFGAGGAITFPSKPESEFEEILLKAEAVLRPVWHYVNSPGTPLAYRLRARALCVEENREGEIGELRRDGRLINHALSDSAVVAGDRP